MSPLETGEGKAHAEIAEEYGVTFRCVAGACKLSEKCPFCNPIFVVESVRGKGAQGGHHGFDMTDSDMACFRKTNAVCQNINRVHVYSHLGEVSENFLKAQKRAENDRKRRR